MVVDDGPQQDANSARSSGADVYAAVVADDGRIRDHDASTCRCGIDTVFGEAGMEQF